MKGYTYKINVLTKDVNILTLSDIIYEGLNQIESEAVELKNKLTKYILSLDLSDEDKDIVVNMIMNNTSSNITYRVMMDKFFSE